MGELTKGNTGKGALYVLPLALAAILLPVSGLAEFICRASVSVKVKKDEQGAAHDVPYKSYDGKGADEAAAKQALALAISSAKLEAMTVCRRNYENLSGCVSTKFSTMAATLSSLTFSARKSLEEAITKDCTKQQGTCVESVASDPVCEAPKVEEEAKDEGKDAGKKDAGKKGEGDKKKK